MHRVWQVKIEQKYYPGRGHVSTNSQYHRLVPWEADLEMEISVQEFFFFFQECPGIYSCGREREESGLYRGRN